MYIISCGYNTYSVSFQFLTFLHLALSSDGSILISAFFQVSTAPSFTSDSAHCLRIPSMLAYLSVRSATTEHRRTGYSCSASHPDRHSSSHFRTFVSRSLAPQLSRTSAKLRWFSSSERAMSKVCSSSAAAASSAMVSVSENKRQKSSRRRQREQVQRPAAARWEPQEGLMAARPETRRTETQIRRGESRDYPGRARREDSLRTREAETTKGKKKG